MFDFRRVAFMLLTLAGFWVVYCVMRSGDPVLAVSNLVTVGLSGAAALFIVISTLVSSSTKDDRTRG